MKILILGAGQVGRTAAYHLSREPANEVTVVDTNDDVLRDLQDRLDIRAVAGYGSHPSVLEAAGIANTDVLVALTSSDEVNIVACGIAQALYRTPTKIARVRAPEYTKREQLFAEGALAVDVWISPEQLVTEYIAQLINYPGALQVVDFADGRVRLVGVRTRRDGLLVGRELRTLREHLPDTEMRVAAIYRNDRLVQPSGDTLIEDNDEIFFVAASDDLRRVMAELRRSEDPVRRLVIAGGGNIGLRLARTLEKSNQVKLIERDPARARRISEILENTIVLNGDAADEELLIEENIDSADVFAALTNSEEANVLSAMLAKRLGAKRVMALINRPSYGELMENHSIDFVISPQTITMGTLLAHVRRGDVVRVHSLRRGLAEAIEAVVHGSEDRSHVVGRRIEQVKLPSGASIVAVVRGENVIMAHHDTVIESEDHVIVFLSDRRHIDAVQRAVPDRDLGIHTMRSLLGVLNIFGSLLAWFAALFVFPIVTALLYGEVGPLRGFVIGAIVAVAGGLLLRVATIRFRYDLKSRDAYLLVTVSWLTIRSGGYHASADRSCRACPSRKRLLRRRCPGWLHHRRHAVLSGLDHAAPLHQSVARTC